MKLRDRYVNQEVTTWKETILAYLKELPYNSPAETEWSHQKVWDRIAGNPAKILTWYLS
jgi:hypothetical protein